MSMTQPCQQNSQMLARASHLLDVKHVQRLSRYCLSWKVSGAFPQVRNHICVTPVGKVLSLIITECSFKSLPMLSLFKPYSRFTLVFTYSRWGAVPCECFSDLGINCGYTWGCTQVRWNTTATSAGSGTGHHTLSNSKYSWCFSDFFAPCFF